MRTTLLKLAVSVLFASILSVAPLAFAAEHGAEAAHGQPDHAAAVTHEEPAAHADAAVHADATHAEPVAHADAAHAEPVAHEAQGHGDAAAAHGEAGGEHHSPMITGERLKDLFWRTANFLALVIILVKFLAKPIANGLSGRRKTIQDDLETLQGKRDEAERTYKEFEGRLSGMEAEMDTIVEKAVALAKNEKARILEEAEQSAEEIKRQAESAVQSAVADAKATLQDEVADQAAAMAEELIVKNLTAKDQVAITEQYLERVGAVQ